MNVYIILFIIMLVLLLASNDVSANRRWNKIRYNLFCVGSVLLILFSCIRAQSVGRDTSAYMKLFINFSAIRWLNIPSYSIRSGYEIGYIIYCKILYLFSHNPQAITVTNSLLLGIFLFLFLKKYSIEPVFSLFLYYTFGFYQTGFNIASNLMAVLFVYANLDCFVKKNYLKSLAVILVAFLFHRATLLLVIIIALEKVKLTPKKTIIFILLSLAVNRFYNFFLPAISFFVSDEYQGYINDARGDNGIILLFHILLLVFMLSIGRLSAKSNTLSVTENADSISLSNLEKWLILMELSAFIISLSASKFSRVAYMFTPIYFIFIPNYFYRVKNIKNRMWLKYGMIFLVSLQYFLRLSINNIGATIPYNFFFS